MEICKWEDVLGFEEYDSTHHNIVVGTKEFILVVALATQDSSFVSGRTRAEFCRNLREAGYEASAQ